MPLYNLRSLTPTTFMIVKFSDDFEVESFYTLTKQGFSYLCDCPANNRTVITKPCRHKLMMPALLPYADTEKFYDFDTKMFCSPLGDLLRPTADPEGREALPDAGEALRAEGEAPCDCLTEDECDRRKGCQVQACEDTMNKPISSVVGEAPGSSIELPTIVVPYTSPKVEAFKEMAKDGSMKVVVQYPIPTAPSQTTIRRR